MLPPAVAADSSGGELRRREVLDGARVLARVVEADDRALREPAREAIVERSARREAIDAISVVIQLLRHFGREVRVEPAPRRRRPQQRMSELGDEHRRESDVGAEGAPRD